MDQRVADIDAINELLSDLPVCEYAEWGGSRWHPWDWKAALASFSYSSTNAAWLSRFVGRLRDGEVVQVQRGQMQFVRLSEE